MKSSEMLKCLLVAALFSSCPFRVDAQRRTAAPSLEALPRIPIDTLDTNDGIGKVVIYTNNTWEYFYPDEERIVAKEIYREHWDTTRVFAYTDIELSDLPTVTELELIEDISHYHSPIVGNVLSKYGVRRGHRHQGVDIPLKVGEPIYATFAGRVRYSRYNTGGYGNLVIIRHENGLETWYAHLSRRNVNSGDYVKAGTVIGFGGNTGRSRGPHLHFEMRYCDQTFDPENLIDFPSGDLRYQTFELRKSYFSIYSRASENLEEEDYDEQLLAAEGSVTSEDILDNIAKQQGSDDRTRLGSSSSSDPLYHTIRKGENLSRIARMYGTSVRRLCELNNIKETSVIRYGQKLRVR